jgi:hypothetical protein
MPKNLSKIIPRVALSKSELIIFLNFLSKIKHIINISGIDIIVAIITDRPNDSKKPILLI